MLKGARGRWEEPRGPAARLEARGHGGRAALRPQGAGDRADAGRRAGAGGAAPLPRAGGASRGFPGGPRPAPPRRARPPRRGASLYAPARGLRRRARGAEHRRGHADRVGQDPLLQPSRPGRHPQGPGRARAVPLPDQGPGPGPARRAVRADRGPRRRHRHLHLRRRHAAGRAQGHPRPRPHRGHQPGHAAQGDPAPPHQVGEAVREPALRDRGRAAQPPRRVRLARGQHLPPPASPVRVLRLAAAGAVLVGHHRQPERAGGVAHGPRDDAHRPERGPARRALLRHVQPAGREPAARHPPLRAGLRARRGAVLPQEGSADHRLRAVAALDGSARHVSQGRAGDAPRLGGRDPRLPRRVPAAQASGDREGPARRLRARCRLHERPRAGHRHRQPGRGGAARLSGLRGLHLAAGRPRGPPHGRLGRGAGGQLHAAEPVHRQAPRLLLRRVRRGGPHQPRQPAHPGQPHQVRGLRAALQRGRPLALALGELPRGRGEPAQRVLRQLRGAGRHARAAHHRRGRLRLRALHAARQGGLHPGGADLFRREVRPRGAARARARSGGGLLHHRHHLHEGEDPRPFRRGADGARAPQPRRGARDHAGGRLQEDQVLHERERGLGRAGHARR